MEDKRKMDRKEIEKRVQLAMKLLTTLVNDMNLPDTNLFYELLLETPVIKERINATKEVR